MTYLAKFIPDLSAITAPLRQAIKKVQFHWESEQREAFKNICDMLALNPVLAYFDPTQQTEVHVDRSKFRIGCVLVQNEHPICLWLMCTHTNSAEVLADGKNACSTSLDATNSINICMDQKISLSSRITSH